MEKYLLQYQKLLYLSIDDDNTRQIGDRCYSCSISGLSPTPPANSYTFEETFAARASTSLVVAASAYTLTTSSVPEGLTKERPFVYFETIDSISS